MKFLVPTALSLIAIALDVELVFAIRRVNAKTDKLVMECKTTRKNENKKQTEIKENETDAIVKRINA